MERAVRGNNVSLRFLLGLRPLGGADDRLDFAPQHLRLALQLLGQSRPALRVLVAVRPAPGRAALQIC